MDKIDLTICQKIIFYLLGYYRKSTVIGAFYKKVTTISENDSSKTSCFISKSLATPLVRGSKCIHLIFSKIRQQLNMKI